MVADGATLSLSADVNLSDTPDPVAANNTANGGFPDEIHFNIAGAGVQTINVLSALPTITDAVVIDGWSEPDFVSTPVIRIDERIAHAVLLPEEARRKTGTIGPLHGTCPRNLRTIRL